jgi:hypothetical protein
MTSEYRAPSQIPRSGTYICLTTNIGVYDASGTILSSQPTFAVGDILIDLGKTIFMTSGGSITKVLRKAQKAVSGGTLADADTFYINIGGDAAAASKVARL